MSKGKPERRDGRRFYHIPEDETLHLQKQMMCSIEDHPFSKVIVNKGDRRQDEGKQKVNPCLHKMSSFWLDILVYFAFLCFLSLFI